MKSSGKKRESSPDMGENVDEEEMERPISVTAKAQLAKSEIGRTQNNYNFGQTSHVEDIG